MTIKRKWENVDPEFKGKNRKKNLLWLKNSDRDFIFVQYSLADFGH